MSHYYTNDGTPMHYVPNASKPGELRETTIRDARKLNLNPSVTTITKIVDQGTTLTDWQIKQALYAALVHPNGFPKCALQPDGSINEKDPAFEAWAKDCMMDARRQVEVKAERGSILHDAMMKAHHDYDSIEPQYHAHVDGMFELLERTFGKRRWVAERNFAHPLGFGGSVDLQTEDDEEEQIILDYKFKDFDEDREAKYFIYDSHRMQLGAYAIGNNKPHARLFNAFGSISHPGLAIIYEHSAKDAELGRRMFLAAKALFEAKHEYKPKWDKT